MYAASDSSFVARRLSAVARLPATTVPKVMLGELDNPEHNFALECDQTASAIVLVAQY